MDLREPPKRIAGLDRLPIKTREDEYVENLQKLNKIKELCEKEKGSGAWYLSSVFKKILQIIEAEN